MRYYILISALFVCLSLFFSFVSIVKHQGFESGGYDLGIFTQHMTKLSAFQSPENTVRRVDNLLSDHFHPILFLFIPFFMVVPMAETLLTLQAFLIASTVFPIFLFTRKRFGDLWALQAASLVGLFWGVHEAIFFDFHEIAFAIPLLGWLIYFMDEKKYGRYWIILGLLLLTKEEFWIFAVFVGIVLAIQRAYKHAVVTAGVGFFGFIFITKILMPFFSSGSKQFQYLDQYSTFGNSTASILFSILTKPLLLLKTMFTPMVKVMTLLKIFAPFLFLPLLSPYILLAFPSLLQRMLSSSENLWVPQYHYTATITAILIMAAIDTLYRIYVRIPVAKRRIFAPQYLIMVMIIINLIILLRSDNFLYRAQGNQSHSQEVLASGYKALSLIPKEASVVADDALVPHLANRDHIYRIADFQWHELEAFDYIIESDTVNDYFISPEKAALYVQELTTTYLYEKVFDENGWRVYKLQK